MNCGNGILKCGDNYQLDSLVASLKALVQCRSSRAEEFGILLSITFVALLFLVATNDSEI